MWTLILREGSSMKSITDVFLRALVSADISEPYPKWMEAVKSALNVEYFRERDFDELEGCEGICLGVFLVRLTWKSSDSGITSVSLAITSDWSNDVLGVSQIEFGTEVANFLKSRTGWDWHSLVESNAKQET